MIRQLSYAHYRATLDISVGSGVDINSLLLAAIPRTGQLCPLQLHSDWKVCGFVAGSGDSRAKTLMLSALLDSESLSLVLLTRVLRQMATTSWYVLQRSPPWRFRDLIPN